MIGRLWYIWWYSLARVVFTFKGDLHLQGGSSPSRVFFTFKSDLYPSVLSNHFFPFLQLRSQFQSQCLNLKMDVKTLRWWSLHNINCRPQIFHLWWRYGQPIPASPTLLCEGLRPYFVTLYYLIRFYAMDHNRCISLVNWCAFCHTVTVIKLNESYS